VAVYARVSSEQQAGAGTISSQLEALKEKVRGDGFDLERDFTFIDEGYSGGTLIRPALERLRDLSALGALDRVYVHSPDRLARNYAYQVLLLDELQHAGVEVVFLNHTPGKTPEDKLLLQVQGMVAEYERAKILERSRRGKLHAARRGSVSVLSRAPYGYEYVPGGGTGHVAEVRVSLEHARIARQIFEWVGKD
jgi:site-specific DNA recombinase